MDDVLPFCHGVSFPRTQLYPSAYAKPETENPFGLFWLGRNSLRAN
jgi:hypothetical protein